MSGGDAERPAEPMQTDPPTASATDAPKPTEAPAEAATTQAAPAPVAKKAKQEHTPEALQSLPVRPYLESTVVPLLMQGLQHLVMDRPEDPVDALAKYLLDNNPKRKK